MAKSKENKLISIGIVINYHCKTHRFFILKQLALVCLRAAQKSADYSRLKRILWERSYKHTEETRQRKTFQYSGTLLSDKLLLQP